MPATATLLKLKVTPVGDRELRLTRFFEAPPRLVFDAFTKPALIRRWLLGPPGWTMPVCEVDLRVGGQFRYVWEKPGAKMGMTGTFAEIAAPGKIVHREIFDDDWTGGETFIATTFRGEHDGTAYDSLIRYQSAEGRAAAIASGMEEGMHPGYDRLAEILAELVAAERKAGG